MTPTHVDRNRATRNQWDSFRPHREQLMQLILDGCPRTDARLCVMGAGNCNDLDLKRLNRQFHRIVLIDIDDEAMKWGIANQGIEDIDLVCRDLRTLATPDEVADKKFDVVVSSCLLTQMFLDVDSSQTDNLTAYAAIRRHHLQSMIRLLRGDGTGIFVTDIVSSDTCADLPGLNADQLQVRLPQLIQQHNFFTGTNPAVVHHLLTADPEFSVLISGVRPIEPWLWNPGPRTYACYGMLFNRSTEMA